MSGVADTPSISMRRLPRGRERELKVAGDEDGILLQYVVCACLALLILKTFQNHGNNFARPYKR